MNNRFYEMTRKALMGLSMVMLCGSFAGCKDDYDLDDEGNYPSWLGGSIYDALKDPTTIEGNGQSQLTGTFNNYVRLIDDLGYAETLGRTGSKTVFAANDEAFARFFANNSWGVKSYEDLTPAMKKQLLYASMLDNALLIEMLANISDGATAVLQGQALKHTTSINVIDSITYMKGRASMPVNNDYWTKFYDKGLHIVMDATRPMMVHFTEEQLTTNSITTRGENSDFEVITGSKYNPSEHSAYVFRNKILNADVTCKNGYIHQMQDVLVPPGNMAQVIRTSGESNYFSRMLDRFAAPYINTSVTKNYNDYAQANGLALIDSIYEMRYMSSYSQRSSLLYDPNYITVQYGLPYDPGWNTYDNGTNENTSKDIAAMFVPTDEALENFFLTGEGKFLMEEFGQKDGAGNVLNDREHLPANIDSIPLQNVQQLLGNLMKKSFVGTVPSKFGHVMDEASDPMGLSLDVINKKNGTYDVKIANNGVIYMLNKMFAPPSLVAVSAPVTLKSNMRIMNVAVNDGKGTKPLSLDLNYYAYLLAMSANYGFFIPTDDAFGKFYVDPSSLADDEPRAMRFYYQNKNPYVFCSTWKCHKDADGKWTVNVPSDSIGTLSPSQFRSQFVDILNFHTVVLSDGEVMGTNKYYKTKHGGAIRFDGNTVGSGAQVAGNTDISNITTVYHQQNGKAYAIDNLIQAPQESVLSVLQSDTATTARFSKFLALCNDFDMDELMAFASDKFLEENKLTKKKRLEAYHTFAAKGGVTDNVNYFNSYNYTVFAPDNDAMDIAYNNGLPSWDDIRALYNKYTDDEKRDKLYDQADRDKALAMVNEINNFIRYHFQDNSVYADNIVETGSYATACADSIGMRQKLTITGGGNTFQVRDNSGQTIAIDASSSTKIVNRMARDYVLNKTSHSILTSSFAVVHQISQPLNSHANGSRYDTLWTGAGARARLAAFRKKFDTYLYDLYDETLKY